MGVFDMVVLVVAIVAIAGVFRAKHMASLEQMRSSADPALRAENDTLRRELQALKDRVATLERIATDSSTALDREIEQLRRG